MTDCSVHCFCLSHCDMASLSEMYALWVFVMALCVPEAMTEVSDEIIFDADNRISSFKTPSSGTNRTVTAGRNITFVCRKYRTENYDYVEWYRIGQQAKLADIQYYSGNCNLKKKAFPNLSVEQTDCEGGQFKLRINEIDASFEADYFCVFIRSGVRYQSQYIGLQVQSLELRTSLRTPAPTTSTLTMTVSRHKALSTKPTEAVTEHSTRRTDKELPPRNTLVPLIGGAAGGGMVLLVLVITGCALYRSKRGSNHPDDGQASTNPNRQPGDAEADVMEGNPLYIMRSPGNDDYAQIDCRESANPSQEKGESSVVNHQPNPNDSSQAGLDCGDIYAVPDKSKKPATDEKGEARMVNHRPDPDDRNQSQAGLDCEDVYAVPDKSKKSATEALEDVYSQVQKPKK